MAKPPRRQHVKLGGFPAVKIGAPSPMADLYYWIMEMNWPAFIALVTGVFFIVNLAFGLIYAALPGAIANAEPGSILDGFYFSVDTLATVGYGTMAPATRAGHALAAIETLMGLFFSATITGLIFARFARPRDSLIFSRVAVVARFQGRRALMVRVASSRPRPMFDASAQMAWLQRVDIGNGRSFGRLVEVPLERARNPVLNLAWTLVHIIDEESEMFRGLIDDDRFALMVSVNGLDTLLDSQSQGSIRYGREDIQVDHDFVDIINEIGGVLHLDLSRLHDTEPLSA